MFDATARGTVPRFEGLVSVAETGLLGMVTIRGDLGTIGRAVADATGLGVPDTLRIVEDGPRALAWMSPDELMLFCPHDEAAALAARLSEALAAEHALVADVSDARAGFTLEGGEAVLREVLSKLTPADLRPQSFPPGMIRRTRLGQVAAAFWIAGDGTLRVICFRSVADYVRGLLCHAAHPASAVGHF